MPTAGSWGCAPFVGTSHSLMVTCSSPTVSSGGKLLPASETGLTRGGGGDCSGEFTSPPSVRAAVGARYIGPSSPRAAGLGGTLAAPSTTAPAASATAND